MSIKKIIKHSAFFACVLSFALIGCKSEEETVTPVKNEPVPATRTPKEECIAGPIVTTPNGGEAFLRGNNIDITWHVSCVDTFTSVKIELLVNNLGADVVYTTLASSTPHDGSYLWTIPSGFAPNSYKVKISSLGATNWDDSNSYFSITDNVNGWLQSPNGGQTITNNSTITVSWNKWLVPTSENSIQLELYKGTTLVCPLASNLFNDGTESVFIPTFVLAGSDYSVKVSNTSTSSTNYSDYSNGYFTIANFNNTAQWLIRPNGNEGFSQFSKTTIIWNYSLVKSQFVKLELIRRTTGEIRTIVVAPNSGSFEWTVNGIGFNSFSSSYVIRISDSNNPGIWDESNSGFSIR